MPNRLICVVILLFWTIAAGALFTRDVLPTFMLGPPPDLRTISQAEDADGPTRWSILAADEGKPKNLRSVGQIVTESKRKRDGWVRMTSTAWLDSGELVKGTLFESKQSERIGIQGACEIDSTGNLQDFRVGIRLDEGRSGEILSVEGRLRKDVMDVTTRSVIPGLNGTQSIPYQPRGIVQNSLGPLERMPGLQVGQTWQTQVVSLMTGKIQTCRVQVVGTEHIIWGNEAVLTLKVVTRMAPITAATWVRADGLVLRQEIPSPNKIKLILERLPDDPTRPPQPHITRTPGSRR
jgi:hypothetical protein